MVGQLHRLDVLHVVNVELRAVLARTDVEAIQPLLHAFEIVRLRRDRDDRIGRFHRNEAEHATERRFRLIAEYLVELGHDFRNFDIAQAEHAD